jgi:hypothetical protein
MKNMKNGVPITAIPATAAPVVSMDTAKVVDTDIKKAA